MEESSGKLTYDHKPSYASAGYGDTDQIDPVVAEALTTYQVEWLFQAVPES
jgi:hypothetical protein